MFKLGTTGRTCTEHALVAGAIGMGQAATLMHMELSRPSAKVNALVVNTSTGDYIGIQFVLPQQYFEIIFKLL